MVGKGAVQIFAVLLVLVCLYQLSFTWLTSSVEKKAKAVSEAGQIDKIDSTRLDSIFPVKPNATKQVKDSIFRLKEHYTDSITDIIKRNEQYYLDSIGDKVIVDLFITKFTYNKSKKQEINLGLDLKGGMSVTLQISLIKLIEAFSNQSTDPAFVKALQDAEKAEEVSEVDFITLFGNKFEEANPNARLSVIFSTIENKDIISLNSTNKEVLDVIRQESKEAIGRTFNVLRKRIDGFGVAQPQIRLLQNTGRIIVELPGVDDPQRIREILQKSAKLEFWECFDNSEIYSSLVDANIALSKKFGNDDPLLLDPDDEINLKPVDDIDDPPILDDDSATISNLDDDSVEVESDSEVIAIPDTETISLIDDELVSDSIVADDTDDIISLFDDDDTIDGDTDGGSTSGWSLFNYMTPNLVRDANGELQVAQETPVVGFAAVKDTKYVMNKLTMDGIRQIFPSNLKLLWDINPRDDQNVIPLYAIKASLTDQEAPLGGDVITNARQDFDDQGRPNIDMNMNSEGAHIWKKLTAKNVDKFIAIVLDNYVVSAPQVISEISGGRSQISGNFTIEEATDIATVLKAGKFPAPTRIIEEAIVGPSLGKKSIQNGLKSLIAGFILVLAFMVLYYARAGTIADFALFANVFFIIGILASFNLTLTLPGIAGLVLTIGMTVDANVIIFERIREELFKGKGLRLAIIDGYKNSYSAIIDANLTTLLTAIILAYFGSGPILGFAFVLIIGIISSLFASVLLTQVLFEFLLKKDVKFSFATIPTKGAFRNLKINFIGLRKVAYLVSATIIGIGIFSMVTRGFEMGVDFKGGRSYTVKFKKAVETTDIQNALEIAFGSPPIVRTFGGPEQVKITTTYLIDDKSETALADAEKKLYDGLQDFLPAGVDLDDFNLNYKVSSHNVGPTIADDIKRGAFYATIFGLLGIFLYILVRFRKWQFGLGAIAALFHDVLIVLSIFSLLTGFLPFSLELNSAFIAAILTIIGYSINDTVVILDRIREYLKIHSTEAMKPVLNKAVNNTLSRTIMTSVTTLMVITILFIFGGEVIRGFTFALMIGIVAGTYSSVFIATPVIYDLTGKAKK